MFRNPRAACLRRPSHPNRCAPRCNKMQAERDPHGSPLPKALLLVDFNVDGELYFVTDGSGGRRLLTEVEVFAVQDAGGGESTAGHSPGVRLRCAGAI